jgi:hypothetical protein
MPTREECLRAAARVLVSIAVRIETDRADAAPAQAGLVGAKETL